MPPLTLTTIGQKAWTYGQKAWTYGQKAWTYGQKAWTYGLSALTLVTCASSALAQAKAAPEASLAEEESGLSFAADDNDGTPPSTPVGVAPSVAAPAATPAPVTDAKATASPVGTTELPSSMRIRGRGNNDSVFGSYRVRMSFARPNFDDGLVGYDKLYGTPRYYPQLSADWYAFDWYATLGLSFRMGYYSADGHPGVPTKCGASDTSCQSSLDNVQNHRYSPDQLQSDLTQTTNLTLIPLQMALTFEFTPFQKKWVVLDGWVGYEHLYWQEVRSVPTAATSASGTGTAAGSTTAPADTSLTDKGWKNATTVGVSANILLNSADEMTAQSVRGSMGIGSIFFSPFIEKVRTLDRNGVSFGRTVLAAAFTFESLR